MTVFDRWAPRLLTALVFLVPLIFYVGLHDTYDLPKMTLVYLCDAILVGLWAWQSSARGSFVIRRSALDVPLSLFLLAAALSTIVSLERSLSLWGSYRTYIFGWFPMASFALLFWLTAQTGARVLERRIFWAALVSAACVGVYAMLQYAGLEIISQVPPIKGGRIWSSLGNPLYTGALCMMAVILGLSRPRMETFVLVLLAAGGLLLSLSRSAWLGFAGGGCILLIAFRRDLRTHWTKVGAAILAIFILGAFTPSVRARAKVLFSARESSNAGRLEGWKAALRIWRASPWLGSGPDTFVQAFRPYRNTAYLRSAGIGVTQAHAHNEPLQFASTQGLVGLGLYVALLGVFFRRVHKVCSGSNLEKAGIMASLVALWIQNLFNFSSVATCVWASIFMGLLWTSGEEPVVRIPCPPSRVFRGAIVGLCVLVIGGIFIPIQADANYQEGLAWSRGNQILRALPHLREAVRLNGRVEIYMTELANAARSAGLWDEAWNTAQMAPRRHPSNPDTWNNQGVAAMWMIQLAGRDTWQVARESFEKAITLDPVFIDAWANLAKWEHLKGNIDKEKLIWQKVMELNPLHAQAREVLKIPG